MEVHSKKGAEILKEKGYPEDVVYAILCHNEHHGQPRKSLMDKTLYAVDELCGLIVAVALVRPNKSLAEVKVKSVKKKMKDKAFARQVSREAIKEGATELGAELDEHIETVLTAMKKIAPEIGL
jgi:predicted hydrolase (HD superfamily)